MDEALAAETVRITGHGGDEIEAYLARPTGAATVDGFAGVVVIHHMPGYDETHKEITRKFAAHGYAAICPNLYWREAPGASADDAAATARAAGGVPDDRLVGDVAGGAARLRGLTGATGKVGVIGYCSGGRQAFLAACRLPFDAAVDCYGAAVLAPPGETAPAGRPSLEPIAGDLSCPLLGLFGADDTHPGPAETARLAAILDGHRKTYDFHTYDGAGHAFFCVDRPSYRPQAAVDGWRRVWEFFGRQLAA